MNEVSKLNQELAEIIGENDPCQTLTEKHAWLCSRFSLERGALLNGQSHLLDKSDWSLALDAVDRLAALLRAGAATREMQWMLADYLTGCVLACDEKTARAILAIPKGGGASNKTLLRLRTIDTYATCLEAGESDERALEAAWLAYYPDKKICEESIRPAGDGSNAYRQSLDKVIKPMLHKAKIRQPSPPGRPKITRRIQ